MSISGIDGITYGVENIPDCRKFFLDWGLRLDREEAGRLEFATLNGCRVVVADKTAPRLPPALEPGSTLREVIWGADSASDVARLADKLLGAPGYYVRDGEVGCIDPNHLAIRIRVSQKQAVDVEGVPMNTWNRAQRIDTPTKMYERAQPVEVGHVVFFTDCLDEMEAFYCGRLGFHVSDRYPGRGLFLRCSHTGGHHDLFLLQLPVPKRGLDHVAFTVRDIHELFGGGMHLNRCGWRTEIGPGRHPVSSAFFWYVRNPAGGLAEYYTDEDVLTEAWQPREIAPTPHEFAEWAFSAGINEQTRREAAAPLQAPEAV